MLWSTDRCKRNRLDQCAALTATRGSVTRPKPSIWEVPGHGTGALTIVLSLTGRGLADGDATAGSRFLSRIHPRVEGTDIDYLYRRPRGLIGRTTMRARGAQWQVVGFYTVLCLLTSVSGSDF
jgi:hypothetical protein